MAVELATRMMIESGNSSLSSAIILSVEEANIIINTLNEDPVWNYLLQK